MQMSLIRIMMLSNFPQFVSASQPLNALAYVFDGLHYGVSDFAYAARSMVSHFLKRVEIIQSCLYSYFGYESCTC